MPKPYAKHFNLDALKQIPIADVAIRLGINRKGSSARCPFPNHDDFTPSFSFYFSTNSCWCHKCSKGGDVIRLVSLSRACSFGEAIRWLREVFALPVLDFHPVVKPQKLQATPSG